MYPVNFECLSNERFLSSVSIIIGIYTLIMYLSIPGVSPFTVSRVFAEYSAATTYKSVKTLALCSFKTVHQPRRGAGSRASHHNCISSPCHFTRCRRISSRTKYGQSLSALVFFLLFHLMFPSISFFRKAAPSPRCCSVDLLVSSCFSVSSAKVLLGNETVRTTRLLYRLLGKTDTTFNLYIYSAK